MIDMNISPAEALVMAGVVQAILGLVEPTKLLTRLRMDAATLVISGVILAMVGFALSVFLE